MCPMCQQIIFIGIRNKKVKLNGNEITNENIRNIRHTSRVQILAAGKRLARERLIVRWDS